MKVGIVAGEPSGDSLGAGLLQALRQRTPHLDVVGIGGDRMLAEGLRSIDPIDQLAVNGFREPILKLPQLIGVFRRLLRAFDAAPPDVFIGVDFNVFNLLLEAALKRRGIPTTHYVSPSVYAWRRGRVKRVARSADLLLTLYPFEPAFYEHTDTHAVFVGHPLADAIAPSDGAPEARVQARVALGLDPDRTVIAVLPGSRRSEIGLMAPPFFGAAARLVDLLDAPQFVVPCVRPALREGIDAFAARYPALKVHVHSGDARMPLVACDAALVKSGTATLEAMLLRRPMVVSYRLGSASYQVASRMLRSEFVALPNILAGRQLVPEFLQHDATPERLAAGLVDEMQRAGQDPELLETFGVLHERLRCDGSARAADAVLGLVEEKAVHSERVSLTSVVVLLHAVHAEVGSGLRRVR